MGCELKMRWKFLVILTVLLLVPLVSATLTIDQLESTSYSWGDDIKVSGVYTTNQTVTGLLRVNLICGEESSQIFVKTIRTEDQYSFDHSTPTTGKVGDCNIQVIVEGLGVREEVTSDLFTINNTLDGRFELSKTDVQLGENLTLSGVIFKSSTQNTEGFVIISINKGNETYLLDTAPFQEESLLYSFIVSSLPAGTYSIDVSATDIYGNQKDFKEVKMFNVYDTLKLTAFFDSLEPKPGESLILEGTVRTMKDELVNGATAVITIDGSKRFEPITDGKFMHSIQLEPGIKSYNHTVKITIQDDYGNTAEKELEFYIKPVPTTLQTKLSQTIVKPTQEVIITPQLFDQASEIMEGDIRILVLDANKNPALEDVLISDEPTTLTVADFASPGIWTLTVTSGELTERTGFTVEAVEEINTQLIGQTLYIRNVGNVRYQKDFLMDFAGSEGSVSVTEALDLYPNESKVLKLKEYVSDGNYTLSFKDEVFEGVEISNPTIGSLGGITGGFVTDLGTGTSIVLILVVLIMILFLFFTLNGYRRRRVKGSRKSRKDFEEGKKMRERLRTERMQPEEKRSTSFESKFPRPEKRREEPRSYRYRPGDRA